MISNIRLGVLVFFSILSIYYYYFVYTFHGQSKEGLFSYLFVVGVIYGLYKIFQISFGVKKIQFSFVSLISVFVIHLLILACMYFGYKSMNPFLGTVLFFKILFFLSCITGLWVIIYNFGKTVFDFIFGEEKIEDSSLIFLSSLGIGFFLFMLGVFLLAILGVYNEGGIIVWIFLAALLGYKNNILLLKNIKKPIVEYSLTDTTDKQRLFIDEIHFLLITFFLGINFMNVYRPFPIGWDDLGVYMNYPKLFAQAGELISLGQMQTWQLYTGIGHIFGNQTFAFFLNSFSGLVFALVVFYALKGLIGKKKYFFSIPLLCVLILLMMPMAIFQLAKDMKLDYGLFSMSIPPLYILYTLIIGKYKFSSKKHLLFFLLIGGLIGLTFSIKVTSLLLLLGILGVIFYYRASISGFLVFLGLFIGAFTGLDVWSMMNVVVPEGSHMYIYVFSSICVSLGILGILINKKDTTYSELSHVSKEVLLVVVGFTISLTPWMLFNAQSHPEGTNIGIKQLISGYSQSYSPEYSLLYSEEEIELKKQEAKNGIESSGVTTNADFGRYFGYEGGINNYLKLPWNLTFQVNQKGEFTDITYLFFALIPAMLLFLPYKKEKYIFAPILALAVLLLYYIPGPIGAYITSYFSHIHLPGGYIFILLFFLVPFIFFHHYLDPKQKITKLFLINYAFLTSYVFLWDISSFGVVWYGIVMYFGFTIIITLGLLSSYKNDEKNAMFMSYIVLGTVWVYVFSSGLPHGINNHKSTTHVQYKLGHETQEEALFSTHTEYFKILHTLNIHPDIHEDFFIQYRNDLLKIIDDISGQEELIAYIQSIENIEGLRLIMNELLKQDVGVASEPIRELRQKLFEEVLYVGDEIKNTHSVYRIGTFLTYFVSENKKRFLVDSLIEKFDAYIYDQDLDVALERMKKLNLPYLLVDLNAATIDKDPRKQLTQRYENLLRFLSHEDVHMVETDSVCLKLALDEYRVNADIEKYLEIAGVNYGTSKERNNKKLSCLVRISELVQENKISNESYPYLIRIRNSYLSAIKKLQESGEEITPQKLTTMLNDRVSHGYKALFEIK